MCTKGAVCVQFSCGGEVLVQRVQYSMISNKDAVVHKQLLTSEKACRKKPVFHWILNSNSQM